MFNIFDYLLALLTYNSLFRDDAKSIQAVQQPNVVFQMFAQLFQVFK